MHETSIAENMLRQINIEAEKQNARPIAVKISCGILNAINDEVLGFAFEAITKGTLCEGIKLAVEHKPLMAKCNKCNKNYEVEFSNPVCPVCQIEDFELLPDAPLILEEIEFQTE